MGRALIASLDGEIGDPAETRLSVLDDGLLRGDGAFEMIKLYDGFAFRLDEHLDRLGRSAAAIELGFDPSALGAEIDAVLGHPAAAADAGLRVVITRGGRRLLLVEELPEWPPTASIALLTLSPSEILAGVKSISSAANMQATRIAAARGADEAVYVRPDGIVLEAPTSSIFWTGPDGGLRTPALDNGILDSITRAVVCSELEVEEGAFGAEELRAAPEAFIASTTREIQPVAAIDGELLETAPGPLAERATAALARVIERERPV